jgi:hypothetical protein
MADNKRSYGKQVANMQSDIAIANGQVDVKCNFVYPEFNDGDNISPDIYKQDRLAGDSSDPIYTEASIARDICMSIKIWNELNLGKPQEFFRKLELLERTSISAYDYFIDLMATNFELLRMSYSERGKERCTSKQNEHQADQRNVKAICDVFPEMAELFANKFRHKT